METIRDSPPKEHPVRTRAVSLTLRCTVLAGLAFTGLLATRRRKA